MNLFALTSLLLCLACYSLALLILAFGKQKLHRYWGFFNIAVGTFGLGMFMAGLTKDYTQAFLFWKIAYFGVGSIGMLFYLVVSEFCDLKNRRSRSLVFIHGFLFSILAVSTNSIVNSLRFSFNQFYLPVAGLWWNLFFSIWILIVIKAFVRLHKYIKLSQGLKSIQGRYLFYGMLLGFISGAFTSVTTWGINIYPVWHFFVSIYAAICTYAIFRYQLMDVRVAVTRLSVFIFVYSLVLGIPFGLAIWGKPWLIKSIGENWFWVPMVTLLVLATAGPSVFLYFRRKAEETLLQEEKRIQGVLIKASEGMTSIVNLPQLLKLIIDILVKNLRLKGAGVYLLDRENDRYVLKASLPETDREVSLREDNSLIYRLKQKKYPLIYEEVHFSQDQPQNNHAKEIMIEMQAISAAIIIPMMLENVLIGFIVLGERTEKSNYSGNLMNVLSAVGTQATLAVQDALYLRAETERVEREGAQARRANLDTMVSTMSHQIFSPLNSIKIDLAFYVDILNEDESINPELKRTLIEGIKNTSDVATHISEIVQSVKDYSRGQIVYENISVEALMKSFTPIKNGINKEHGGADYSEDIEQNLPLIYGDQTMLKEILVIFLNNAHHALKRNAGEKAIKLNIRKLNGNVVRFEVVDNGYGIDSDVKKKLFETIYTTKAGGQGLGIGLSRVRRVCELMSAKYGFDSDGEGKGARFWVDVKIVKEDDLKKSSE